MEPHLQATKLNKYFKDQHVLKDVSFEVHRGEILGIVGPNGAGKSTTIRSILGIFYPDSGTITFEGKVSRHIPQHKLGYLPEERGLYRNERVMDILLYLADLKNYPQDKAKARAEYYLQKFGLEGKEKSKIEELSKGMAQKVQFISSVIHEPSFIVLDEPFSGLDPVSQDIFKQEIRNLRNSGASILLSSHQMNFVEEICDRLFLMNKGQRLLYGTMEEIKASYSDFKCTIKGDNHHLNLDHIDGVKHIERKERDTVLLLEKDVQPIDVLRQLPEETHITELHVDRISLHDIFVSIAQGGASDEE